MFMARREEICRKAEALRPDKDSNVKSTEMRASLIGEMDPKLIGHMMYHNNTNHNCTTVNQCSQLVKLFDAPLNQEKNYNKAQFLTETLMSLDKYVAIDVALEITPCPTCTLDRDPVGQLSRGLDVMSLVGPKKPNNASDPGNKSN